MFVITATFVPDLAYAALAKALALGDSPDQLAELLGITRDLDMVRQGVASASFKKLVADLKKRKRYLEIDEQIAEAREGKSMARFFGAGYREKQVARLEEERKKFGSLLETPTWFYQQPRVRLLSAVRDHALDCSVAEDASWNDIDLDKGAFPIAAMFAQGNIDTAQALTTQLEKPLKEVDPKFLLQSFEGHRSISFDLETKLALYYAPAPTAT